MVRNQLRAAAEGLLTQARAMRAACGDPAARAAVDIGRCPVAPSEPYGTAAGWTALVCLWQEAARVRAGGEAGAPWVLDDEVANVERMLAGI